MPDEPSGPPSGPPHVPPSEPAPGPPEPALPPQPPKPDLGLIDVLTKGADPSRPLRSSVPERKE